MKHNVWGIDILIESPASTGPPHPVSYSRAGLGHIRREIKCDLLPIIPAGNQGAGCINLRHFLTENHTFYLWLQNECWLFPTGRLGDCSRQLMEQRWLVSLLRGCQTSIWSQVEWELVRYRFCPLLYTKNC